MCIFKKKKKQIVTCCDCVWLNAEEMKCMAYKHPMPLSAPARGMHGGVLEANDCEYYTIGSMLNKENVEWILKTRKWD